MKQKRDRKIIYNRNSSQKSWKKNKLKIYLVGCRIFMFNVTRFIKSILEFYLLQLLLIKDLYRLKKEIEEKVRKAIQILQQQTVDKSKQKKEEKQKIQEEMTGINDLKGRKRQRQTYSYNLIWKQNMPVIIIVETRLLTSQVNFVQKSKLSFFLDIDRRMVQRWKKEQNQTKDYIKIMKVQKNKDLPTEEQLPELVVEHLTKNKKKGGRKATQPVFEKNIIAYLEDKIEKQFKLSVKSLKLFARQLKQS